MSGENLLDRLRVMEKHHADSATHFLLSRPATSRMHRLTADLLREVIATWWPDDEEKAQDGLTAALVCLAARGIAPDIQELLVNGNPKQGVKPGALAFALSRFESPRITPRQFNRIIVVLHEAYGYYIPVEQYPVLLNAANKAKP